jgi:hypothetical protein
MEMASVGEWLRSLRLESYEDAFVEAGFDLVRLPSERQRQRETATA